MRDWTWLVYHAHLLPLMSLPPIRPFPALSLRPKLSGPSPLIPVPRGGSSLGTSFGASSLIIGCSIFCCSCSGGGGGGVIMGGGGGARLTSVIESRFDEPPLDATFATT